MEDGLEEPSLGGNAEESGKEQAREGLENFFQIPARGLGRVSRRCVERPVGTMQIGRGCVCVVGGGGRG